MRRRHRPSLRLRLAALLAAIFLVFGGLLLAVSYALVRSNLASGPRELAEGIAGRSRGDDARRRALAQEIREAVQSGADLPPDVRAGRDAPATFLGSIRELQQELTDDALRTLTTQYLIILAAMTVLSSAAGWFVAGRMLRPIRGITATARRVSRESLHERIALEGPDDELKQLGDTFDSMLARLEAAFDRQAAFVRNASHELRTPLAVIRTESDVSLGDEAGDAAALRRSLHVVRAAADRSQRLIEALLALASADRADRPRVVVDLAELCARELDGLELGGLELRRDLQPARVIGDPELLLTLVANLVGNAVRHNVPDGWLEVRTAADGPHAVLEVSNSGRRVSPERAAALIEPFTRLDHDRTGEGAGLGLSIAGSVAAAHGGRLDLDARPDGGLRVEVSLPTGGT